MAASGAALVIRHLAQRSVRTAVEAMSPSQLATEQKLIWDLIQAQWVAGRRAEDPMMVSALERLRRVEARIEAMKPACAPTG